MAVSDLYDDVGEEASELLLDPGFDVQEPVGGDSEGSFASKLRLSFFILGLALGDSYRLGSLAVVVICLNAVVGQYLLP